MRDAETTLAIIGDRGKRGLPLENVYRRLFNKELYLRAYARLATNDGAMTKGTTPETVDGMSERKIEKIIELIRQEKFQWSPVRRTMIPKANGKTRPLGIPSWSDKLVQEVIRSILEAFYEPCFSPNSHGYRPGRGCHTALKDASIVWRATKWFIEGDIKGCFDNIDHTILLETLRERIHDNRFIRLIENMLKAGYLKDWKYHPTLSGTPQGGIVSPLLANIYLDQFDKFVEMTLAPEYTRGKARSVNKVWKNIGQIIRRARLKGKGVPPDLVKTHRKLSANDPMDPNFRRLRYMRYADDFILAFIGPKDEAEKIKERIGEFLRDKLKLELSPEKTLITNAGNDKARFLGYEISINTFPRSCGSVQLRIPPQVVETKARKYMRGGKIWHRAELLQDDDFSIVAMYGREYRGIANYYALAENRWWLARLGWVMRVSLLKTLANKHKSTVSKMARKYRAINWGKTRYYKCLKVIIERPNKDPLVAIFGGFGLGKQPAETIEDRLVDLDRKDYRRTEMLQRLAANTCELCGSDKNVEVHHVRKMADLKVRGQRAAPAWKQVMSARRRKTLITCARCHDKIHKGEPTGTPPKEKVG